MRVLILAQASHLAAAAASPSADFWRDRRVFLTGHTGFKGTWLNAWLRRLGARVFGLALPPDTDPSLFTLLGSGEDGSNCIGDIRDASIVINAMRAAAPEIVFHLAAQSLVRRSYVEPLETIKTNVLGTVHVLEAVRCTSSVRAVVVVTSDKCYENREWLWPYRENEMLGGYDPYSASKACAEILVSAWRRSFLNAGTRVALATARAGNVIGGGDWNSDRLIPDCARALSSGRPVGIRNPNSTRPWQYVLEPLSGYLLLAERLCASDGARFAEAWNFGPVADDVQPVLTVVKRAVAAWGDDAAYKLINSDGGHEAGDLAVDAAKARAHLGWRPRLRLAQAIDWTMEWYKRQHRGEAAAHLVDEQIVRYGALSGADE